MKPELSVIIIGFNEAGNLPDCFRSVIAVQNKFGYAAEIIFVDGGSEDRSLEIAADFGIDLILGGEKRRKAAENRNLGFRKAKGKYIQFLDGDMQLETEWLESAVGFLDSHENVAAVCGNLNEQNRSVASQAFEIDWGVREEVIRHCGGAALWRKDVLEKMGGFPEDVVSGEEPYLCWRVRNELGLSIYQLNQLMAVHDLGHIVFGDYWKRNIRTGRIYAEISEKVKDTSDPLWLSEVKSNYYWFGILLFLTLMILVPVNFPWGNLTGLMLLVLILMRKVIQSIRGGVDPLVSIVYSLHTYFCKIPIALGQFSWTLRSLKNNHGG